MGDMGKLFPDLFEEIKLLPELSQNTNTNPLVMYYFFVIDPQMSPEILSSVPRIRDPGHVPRVTQTGSWAGSGT